MRLNIIDNKMHNDRLYLLCSCQYGEPAVGDRVRVFKADRIDMANSRVQISDQPFLESVITEFLTESVARDLFNYEQQDRVYTAMNLRGISAAGIAAYDTITTDFIALDVNQYFKPMKKIASADRVTALDISPNGETLVIIDCAPQVTQWDISRKTKMDISTIHPNSWFYNVSVVRYTIDSRYIATVSLNQFKCIDLLLNTAPLCFDLSDLDIFSCLSVVPHSNLITCGTRGGKIIDFNPVTNTHDILSPPFPVKGRVEEVCASTNRSRIAVIFTETGEFTGLKHHIFISSSSRKWNRIKSPVNDWCHNLQFSPDDRILVYSSYDTVYLYDITSQRTRLLRGHSGQIKGISFSADSAYIISADRGGTVRLWHAGSGRLLGTVQVTADVQFTCMAFRDNVLALGCSDDRVRLYEVVLPRETEVT